MTAVLDGLARQAGVDWFDYQLECFDYAKKMQSKQRLCLYYRTGAGKTITSLAVMNLWGCNNLLVIAPPSTHTKWTEDAKKLGMNVDCISHAKFRQPDYKLERGQAVIADEFHLFGGHSGKGWKKFDTLARGLQGPLILMSATPNYNDADRVYCIQHVLDPHSVKGGFIEFLYKHCETEQDPFSMTPKVLGFRQFADAAEYLASLPDVLYLPDELVYTIDDFPMAEKIPPEMEVYGLDRRRGRIIASIIEAKHARIFHSLIEDDGTLHDDVFDFLVEVFAETETSVLIYCNHSTVAEAVANSVASVTESYGLITGKTHHKVKDMLLEQFRKGHLEVLIGTATLATGTDGLDQVCDELIIVDDTEDNSLRRQLIGRIMPRGTATSSSHKQVRRLVLQ